MIQSGDQRIYYSGDTGYFGGFKQVSERFGGFGWSEVANGCGPRAALFELFILTLGLTHGLRLQFLGDAVQADEQAPTRKQVGERFGGIDLALMENGAYDANWPAVHMTPEESVLAFEDLRAKVLYSVHNSTFDLAFHRWRDPLDRLADLAAAKNIELATPEIGELLTVGKPRISKRWWQGLE